MANAGSPRRRPALHVTKERASRLHRLVRFLAESPRARSAILSDLKISLRTFYRELDLLSRCGVKVRYQHRLYQLLRTGPEPAEGRLPFPDPQLTFAEMAELAVCPCPAAQRLSDLLEAVIKPAEPKKRQSARSGKRKT